MIVGPVFEKPLRRSKREKRLLFTTFNVSQIDKQILNSNNDFPELDLSEVELQWWTPSSSVIHGTKSECPD